MEQQFYEQIRQILSEARNKVYQTANFAMVEVYWNIGKSIVEQQDGEEKASLQRILKICVSFILFFKKATHCVAN